MNERSPPKSNTIPTSPKPSSRRSPLASPRQSPRSFSEKRALFGKMQQHRALQMKLKAADEIEQMSLDLLGREEEKGPTFGGDKDSLLPPAMPKSSPPRMSPPRMPQAQLSPVRNKSNNDNNQKQDDQQKQQQQQLDKIPSVKIEISNTSPNNSFTPNLQTISQLAPTQDANSSYEEEFSEVFGGGLRTVYSQDLTKRVLDRVGAFTQEKSEMPSVERVGRDDFDRESCFTNHSFNSVGEMFEDGGSFDKDILEESEFSKEEFGSPNSFEKEILGDDFDGNVDRAADEKVGSLENDDNLFPNLGEAVVDVENDGLAQEEISVASSKSCKSADTIPTDNITAPKPSSSPLSAAAVAYRRLRQKMRDAEAKKNLEADEQLGQSEVNDAQLQSEVKKNLDKADARQAQLEENEQQRQSDTISPLNKGASEAEPELELKRNAEPELASITQSLENLVLDEPKTFPVDPKMSPKMSRRHKIATRAASGKVNLPKFFTASLTGENAAVEKDEANVVGEKEEALQFEPAHKIQHDSNGTASLSDKYNEVVDGTPESALSMSTNTDIEPSTTDSEVVQDLAVDCPCQSQMETPHKLSEDPAVDVLDESKTPHVDLKTSPKMSRLHKIAIRAASGKVNLPKTLQPAVASANDLIESKNEARNTITENEKPLHVEPALSVDTIIQQTTNQNEVNAMPHEDDEVVEDLVVDRPMQSEPELPSSIDPKLKRRHKMASRAASGKVNVPKSFLSAAATSANAVAELENGAKINVEKEVAKQPLPEQNEDSIDDSNSVLERLVEKYVPTTVIHNTADKSKEDAAKPKIEATTNEQSVELIASLNDLLSLPRQSACPQQSVNPAIQVRTNDLTDEMGRNMNKNQRQKPSDEEKNTQDIMGITTDGRCFGSVGEDEAKKLFPMPSFDDAAIISLKAQEPMSPLDCYATQLEPAWDEKTTSELDTIMEQAKTRNSSNRKTGDDKSLLELDVISSDTGQQDPGVAAEMLLSQKERVNMYTNGKGFGVGEDSSVEVHESENEGDDNFDTPSEYQRVDDGNYVDTDAVTKGADLYDFGKGRESSEVHPTDKIFDDSLSEIDKASDFFDDTNSSTTGGGTVLGLRFIGSADETLSLRSRATPPGSPADIDSTPKIGAKDYPTQLEAVREEGASDKPKLFKIAPPPPEKLRQWEESKQRGVSAFNPASGFKQFDAIKEVPDQGTPKQDSHPHTPKTTPSPPLIGHEKVLSLKISTPKSPSRKKPNTITEELNLSSHTKMAEKFAIASFKAAKKFEERYSHIEHDIQYGPQAKSPEKKGVTASTESSRSRFFCAAIPTKETENEDQAKATTAAPGVAELVGGAFSPWKIPDRADEDSNASSSRILFDDEAYAKASSAALNAIHGKAVLSSSNQLPENDLNTAESVEVSPDWASGYTAGVKEVGLLSGVLVWLFNEVLPSNAYSAFDIDTSTSVQAARIYAIANDDTSLNLICQHVTKTVIQQHGNAISPPEKKNDFATEITNASSSGDLSTSTSSSLTESKSSFSERAAARLLKGKKRSIESFSIPIPTNGKVRPPGEMLAANFISYLHQISYLTGVELPLDENPFLQSVVNLTTKKREHSRIERKSMQELVFDSEEKIVKIFLFLNAVCQGKSQKESLSSVIESADDDDEVGKAAIHSPLEWKESLSGEASGSQTLRRSNKRKNPIISKGSLKGKETTNRNLNLIFPKSSPSPFEMAVWNDPSIMLAILSFLGNPVSVCVVKRLNVFCNRLVNENEHVLMRDAVRLGGMSKFVRPSFWLWVTMERCSAEDPIPLPASRRVSEQSFSFNSVEKPQTRDFTRLKDDGAAGKWQHIIERDVLRAFGNMPPHKTGAKYRQDSIVRALVSFGKEEIMRNSRSYQAMDKVPEESEARHFKLSSRLDHCADGASDDSSETPTDTVSDWGGVSPVGSMVSEEPSAGSKEEAPIITNEPIDLLEVKPKSSLKLNSTHTSKSDVCDPVLSGNALTNEMKVDLQNKLRSILHALAAQHAGLGYCQGMDYVVAHLLRVLQDTILLRVIQGSMQIPGIVPACSSGDWKTMPAEQLRCKMNEINSETEIVDETVFRVMDTLFTTYNLQHMYWPELRCLKTCCRVFENLIKQKLPVLADHFEHHDLNVGLFALGWFQTLFLYLPSMPSATVCHMWDIWLVERSFKIFFRVGTAILFLSQPTLLNHDLEGMMTYLNTFPDATLLRRDILIPCALQIKITNSMLVEIEMDVTNYGNKSTNDTGGGQYSVY